MKWPAIIFAVALSMVPSIAEAQTANSDIAAWKTYRSDSGEYEFKYPDALSLSTPKGTTCSNGDCRPIEEVMLRRLDATSGSIRTIQFMIQRGVNSQRLSIQQWYEAMAHRPLDAASERTENLGGRTAIRRGSSVPGVTVHIGGKTVSTTQGMVPDNTTYIPLGANAHVPLNATDILTVSFSQGPADWNEICNSVLSTLSFTK